MTMKLKNILVPIDFSECAKNALKNAIQLAKIADAKLVLLNAFHVPVPHSPVGTATIVQTLAHEVEEVVKQDFNALEKSVPELRDIRYQCVIKHGFAVEQILLARKAYEIDLIVMGTLGATGVDEVFLGSNANQVIKKSKIPVLAIPGKASIRGVKKIVLASDYDPVDSYEKLRPIKMITELLNAELHILHISNERYITNESSFEARSLERALRGVKRSYHYLTHQSFEGGLFNYIEENNIDMVAMLPREHSLLERILKSSHTRKIAFHSKIPLLTIKI